MKASSAQRTLYRLTVCVCVLWTFSSPLVTSVSCPLSISSEFLALMKKVTKSPLVMDVLNLPGVQKSLERLADLLGKIQKALGDYLERERASFPRYLCDNGLERGCNW